jgi:hypothetical protein
VAAPDEPDPFVLLPAESMELPVPVESLELLSPHATNPSATANTNETFFINIPVFETGR